MNSRSNSWTDLNEALLDKIFALVCTPEHGLDPNTSDVPFRLNSNLPLVCRRFNAAYKSSPTLWRRVTLDWAAAINPPGLERRFSTWAEGRNTPSTYNTNDNNIGRCDSEIPRFGYICRWLLSRAPLIQYLTLTNCHILGPALELQLLPLCTQATRLISLHLLDFKGNGDGVLAAVSNSSSSTLRVIKLTGYQPSRGHTVSLRVCRNSLQELVNNLKSVESVDLEIDSLVVHKDGADSAFSALTSSAAASGADCQVISNMWSNLEKLTSFKLSGRMESVVLHPDMLSSFKNIQKLELINVRLPQFSPAMVASLSKVSFLSLKNVLAAKSRRKSGFTLWNALPGLKSLKKLVILGAGRDAELPKSALACCALESLTIQDCSHVGNWPLGTAIDSSPITIISSSNTPRDSSYPALETLQHLSLIDIGVSEVPPVHFWRSCRKLTSLTWRNVHHAAPRHRYWDHGGACEITNAMEPVLRMLRVLCLEFSGMQEEQLIATAAVLHSAIQLRELSLRGNRLGGTHGIEIANASVHDKMELERLSLVNCGLKSVPADIFSLSSLTELDLSNNPRLESEEEDDRKLKKIKVVKRNDRQAILAASLPKLEGRPVAPGG
jgi:Leucine-rich repeat (LRR) protein